jgi:hypothetical protein
MRMNFAAVVRNDLAARARKYALAKGLPHSLSYGETAIACFAPHENESEHGNFLSASYRAIRANPAWMRRLSKVHTQARRSLPMTDRGRWNELDSCMSSDALLMNIFCYPGVFRGRKFAQRWGIEPGIAPRFGYKARVPLANGRSDRTEVDLRLGSLLIEAKLTENNFQSAKKDVVRAYRDFSSVFSSHELPQTESHYLSYQLLRNVLAAYSLQCSFCVLVDERRRDLMDAWYAVLKCVKPVDLRTQLKILTWQEVAQTVPPRLQVFLAGKYGIGDSSPTLPTES